MEQRVAGWITDLVGGSVIAAILVVFAIFGVLEFIDSGFNGLASTWSTRGFIVFLLYVFAIYLVASLKDQSIIRRVASWSFSLVFHLGLLVYVGFALDSGVIALVVAIPEIAIAILSGIGLAYCLFQARESA